MANAAKAFAVVDQLQQERLLETYAIGGAIGALFYLEPTHTQDIDIFVHLEPRAGEVLVSLDPLMDRLNQMGYVEWSGDNIVVEGWPVQFIPVFKPVEVEALKNATRRPYGDARPFVMSREYLMAIALDLSRPKDKIRLEQFYRQRAFDPEVLATILRKHGLEEKWRRLLASWDSGPSLLSSG
jgi:hypothetical protein